MVDLACAQHRFSADSTNKTATGQSKWETLLFKANICLHSWSRGRHASKDLRHGMAIRSCR